jgi:hypothetical protein
MKPMGAAFAGHSSLARQSGFSTVAAARASCTSFSSSLDRLAAALLEVEPYNPFLHTAAKYPTGVFPAERLLRRKPEELPRDELLAEKPTPREP